MNTMTELQRDKLVLDLKSVINDAEELLRLNATDMGAEATAMRDRVRARLSQAKDGLVDLQETTVLRARAAGRRADEYVHEHPWPAMGVAAGVGLLVGLLMSRR